MTKVFSVSNQKGGVGKSTTSYHLTRAAATQGKRVLAVDLDPQGNLTKVLAPALAPDDEGTADALSARSAATFDSVRAPTIWDGVDIIPTLGEALNSVRDELVIAGAGRESRLRAGLEPIKSEYDIVIIDTAPAIDQLSTNGLVAADEVLIVTQSKLWSADGLARLIESIDTVREFYNPNLTVAGILFNQHEGTTLAGAHWLKELSQAGEARGLTILRPPIPKRVIISDAHESGMGLDEVGTKDAQELANLYTRHLNRILQED